MVAEIWANTGSGNNLISGGLRYKLGYPAMLSQALWPIVLVVFGAIN